MSTTNLFDTLRAEVREGGVSDGVVMRNSSQDVGCRVLCAVSCYDKRASVIIELDDKSQLPAKLPQLKGYTAARKQSAKGPYVAFEVADLPPSKTAALAEHLLLLVASQIRPGLDSSKTVALFVDGLNRLHKVLSHSNELLSAEARLGLFGELTTVRDLLIPTHGAALAVKHWTGPHAAPQDFQGDTCAFEVKTTRGGMPQRLKISSERQLDTRTLNRLYLIVISVEERPAQGITLPQMVDSVRGLVSSDPSASAALEEALLLVHYRDEHAASYAEEMYAVRDIWYFHVRDGFPRITESMIPSGLGKVSYEIEVGACEPFKVQEDAVRSYLADGK